MAGPYTSLSVPLVLLLLANVPAAADAFDPAVTITDVDLEATRLLNGGKPRAVNKAMLERALDPKSVPVNFTAGGPPNWKTTRFDYLIAFKNPIAVGTLLAQGVNQYTKGLAIRALKPEAGYPGDPARESDWLTLDADREDGDYTCILPVGFQTRAILCTEHRWLGPSRLSKLVLLRKRLHNVTPHCLAQGEMASGAWDPMNVPRDDTWHNAGTIGESKEIHRRPVTSIDPSWFLLTREKGIAPVAMRLRSNITDFKLYAFRGEPDVSPALAPAKDWERVPHVVLSATPFNPRGGSNVRILTMNGVRSRAFKLALREVNPKGSKVAAINEWTVWEDLGEGDPPPLPKSAAPPPALLDFDISRDAEVAVVVDDLDGIRMRNIMAQVSREAGPNQVAWDLKDEDGRYVDVGTYRMKGIYAPPLELVYQHTYYPSVEMHSPESRPWPGRPQDGWLANHANHTAVAAVGDRLYISAGGTEGGHAIIETDLSGQKKWGGRWGADKLFTDGKTLFIVAGGRILRFDTDARKAGHIITPKNETRRGRMVGMAAHDNRVHLAFHGPFPYFDRIFNRGHVDLEACLPKLPEKSNPRTRTYYGIPAYPQDDFLRLIRLSGAPAGLDAAGSLTYIPSTDFSASRQFVVVAFKKPIPIGGIVFPALTHDEYTLHLSVLKPDAAYPPNPKRDADWIPFAVHHETAWEVLPAPRNTITRALRITFTRTDADGLEDLDGDESMDVGGELTGLPSLGEGDAALDSLLGRETWTAQLEGMQIMRRRFKNLFGTAKILVSSGDVDEATGEWHAQREKYIWPDNPGVYILEWDKRQKLCGLAIKEIDGMKTFIDVYVGPDDKTIDTSVAENVYDYQTSPDWKCVGLYRQKVRSGSMPSARRNVLARYLEGFVNFGREYETRAVRLRVSEQWPKRALRRRDQGGGMIDARRCNIYGVAPLQYLGGEPATGETALTMKRLSVYDGTTGDVIEEMPSEITGPIAFAPDGRLFAISGGAVVEVDRSDGAANPGRTIIAASDFKAPRLLTIDQHGNFYVYDDGRGVRVVRRYSPAGKFLNLIGDPGPKTAGPWNPGRFGEIVSISADKEDGLWLIYPHENPRRTIHFKTDGTFVKEMLGNTLYGGGGVLDPYDKTLAYFKDVVFKIDWGNGPADKATSRVDSLRTEKFWEASLWGGWRPNMTVRMVNGRKYFVTTPLSHQYFQFNHQGFVYVYDETTKTMRFCAGIGSCSGSGHFSSGRMLSVLNGRDPATLKFMWSDLNGNGEMDPDEVEVSPRPTAALGFGDFDTDLGIMAGTLRYEVKKFLADGTPVYHEVPVTPPGGLFRLDNGNYWAASSRGHGVGFNMVNQVCAPDGRRLWTYWSTFDVSGLYIPPWSPGRVNNQFAMIGHETAHAGDLGEFMVFHANTGQWNIWTADGLLAGHVTLHTGDPRRRLLGGSEYHRGARLDGITAGQEHFHGFFCKTREDNAYKIVIGGNHATIVEVRGLEKFKRFEKKFTVTREMMEQTRVWEARRLQRRIYTQTPTVTCSRRSPAALWGDDVEHIDRYGLRARFRMAYDKRSLFAHWTVVGAGPFKNSPDDFQRLFKTGAAVDLMLGTDPAADPKRTRPVAGDIRIVLAAVEGQSRAVIYRPVAPGAPAGEAWETSTQAGGTARFEQVKVLSGATLRWTGTANTFDVYATIPLKDIGLRPGEGAILKMDWGILSTDEGRETVARDYWVDKMAVGTRDEPSEARLHPDRWGYVKFAGRKRTQVEQLMDGESPDQIKGKDLDDIMDGLEDI